MRPLPILCHLNEVSYVLLLFLLLACRIYSGLHVILLGGSLHNFRLIVMALLSLSIFDFKELLILVIE